MFARPRRRIRTPLWLLIAASPEIVIGQSPMSTTPAVVRVSTVTHLYQAIQHLQSNTVLVLDAGNYVLTSTLHVDGSLTNIAIRGATGNRDDVALLGPGIASGASGSGVMDAIWVSGAVDGITIADLTIRDLSGHAIVLDDTTRRPRIANVHLADVAQAFVDSRVDGAGGGVAGGIVESSTLEYSSAVSAAGAAALDVRGGTNWIVRDNIFRNFA